MRIVGMALALTACQGVAELVTSECASEECPVCEADLDCVIAHNPCNEIAVCGHIDEALAVTAIGCSAALEYDTPPVSACTCQQRRCAAL